MASYRIQVYTMGATFGPGTLVAEFENAKNVGWANYLNDVPEAFFTILQTDPKVELLRSYNKANAHVKIYRGSDLVFAGILGEWDANNDDVIFSVHGYLSLFFYLLSSWEKTYTSSQIDTIVSGEFTYVRDTLTYSPAKWLSQGTIDAPVTTSGGATAIVLPTYKLFYKRFLHTLRELAAMAISDTTNTVVFEVTPSGTFNFWKNRGTDVDFTLRLGDGIVAGYGESNIPVNRRNDILAVGVDPNDSTLRQEEANATDYQAVGRRQEPLFLTWVRDTTELDRTLKVRAAEALRTYPELTLRLFPDALLPPGATGAPFKLSDRVNAVIDNGITSVNGKFLVKGVQVLYMKGQERVRLMLEQRSGS